MIGRFDDFMIGRLEDLMIGRFDDFMTGRLEDFTIIKPYEDRMYGGLEGWRG